MKAPCRGSTYNGRVTSPTRRTRPGRLLDEPPAGEGTLFADAAEVLPEAAPAEPDWLREAPTALLGIVTDGDLRRMLQKEANLTKLTASDIMTKTPKTINRDEYAVLALQIMQQNNITQLVVKDGDKVAGFVHLHDLLKEGIV